MGLSPIQPCTMPGAHGTLLAEGNRAARFPDSQQGLVRILHSLCDLFLQSLGNPHLDDGLSCHAKSVSFPVQ